MPVTEQQLNAVEELRRRGALEGARLEAADELLRRHGRGSRAGDTERARKLESLNSGTGAFMNSFADAATLGLAGRAVDAINAGARSIGIPALEREERLAVNRQQAAESPVMDVAGSVGGALAGGAGVGGAAARLGLRPAQRLGGRLAQYAGAGAAGGAAEQAITEGELSGDTVASGVIGGLAGMAGGGVAEKVLPSVAPRVSRAWRKLAAKLRTPVEDMAAFIDDTRRATGQMPSVAQAIDARDQGLLQGWAARHNTFGSEMDKAARAAPGQDLNVGKIKERRRAQATETMDPIRDTEVRVPPELLGDPAFNKGVPRALREKVRDAAAGEARLTIADVDVIRRRLRKLGDAPQNLGEDYPEVREELENIVGAQVPEYARMVREFKEASDFERGFKHGMAGRAASEAEGQVARSLETPQGDAGLNAGGRTLQGQRALRTMAPSVPADEPDIPGLREAARGVGHVATGGQALGTFHIGQALRGVMDRLPESYQEELAKGLLARDTATIQQTLGRLRQAGADLATIRQLSAGVSAILGANAARAAGGE